MPASVLPRVFLSHPLSRRGRAGSRFSLVMALAAGSLSFLFFSSGAQAATFVVTTNADGNHGACTVTLCTLRDAIIAANASPGSTITLPSNGSSYTLSLTGIGEDNAATGDLDIKASVTINGGGAATTVIDGNSEDRVFDILGGTVIINDVTITDGEPASGDNGGGIQIASGATVTLNRCVVSSNNTFNGGNGAGISTRATLNLNDTTVSGNHTGGGGNGGGVYADGLVTMTGSTVAGNTAGSGDGGGIYVFFELRATNSTISGNSAVDGGGLFNDDTVTLRDTTIANNNATSGGGINNSTSSLTLTNTIVANNPTGGNCSGSAIANGGTNLQFPGTTCGAAITSADPVLGPLASNGGPTQTHALLAGSAAIDNGTTGCPPTPATDQRGVSRPQGVACDIGSFEVAVGAPTPTPTNTPVGVATSTPTSTPTLTPTTLPATPTQTPTAIAGVVVPTLTFPMLGLLGLILAVAGTALLFLKRG
jgi:CSLREA domain-containing protein